MYSETNLFEEVSSIVTGMIEANGSAQPAWVTQQVLKKHKRISGADKAFYVLCAAEHVRDSVRRVLRKYRPDPESETDPQLVLPGYDRLQRAYLVNRGNEQVVVRIDLLTDEEIDAKIAEYQRMAAGLKKHANELRRYKQKRRAAISAPAA